MNSSNDLNLLRQWRKDLHQIPELGLELPETQNYLASQLESLDCEITRPIEYGLAAFFDGGKEKTIAFRTDMDALPVFEQSDYPYPSQKEGRMHACGHDGHMSNMLLLSRRINEIYKELPCNILLIFQPGEETPGGAYPILQTGIFEEKNVVAVFGMHLWPHLAKGEIATRKGPLMSSATEVNVTIHGKAVHAARHQEGIDAMEVAARFLEEVYRLERSIPDDIYRLLQFGKMTSGRVRNVVADTAVLEGTFRSFDDETHAFLKNGMEEIARKLEEQTGATIDFWYSTAYPPVHNDEALCERVMVDHPEILELEKPEMISEDFAWYQKKVPGIFFFVGTGTGIELHDSRFNFDEEILLESAKLFEQLARMEF